MSTQTAQSIDFTHTYPQQGFRLLELSPELLELLSSNNPPALYLKSPSSDAHEATSEVGTREYVNLCTPTKTFRLRQVHTSNSVHIIRPSDGSKSADDGTYEVERDELNLMETMTVIAKCGSTLEFDAPEEGTPTSPFLEKGLILYDSLSTDADVETSMLSANLSFSQKRRVKDEIFGDVPASMFQCESAWTELCAFVHENSSSHLLAGFRPSASVKLDVWKRTLEGSVIRAIDLAKQFLVKDLWNSILDDGEDEPFPWDLFQVVVRRLAEPPGQDELRSEIEEPKWANIDKTTCIRWVGETYLEAKAPAMTSAIEQSQFMKEWMDLLPESWRDDASVTHLTEGSYRYQNQAMIYFISNSERQKERKNASNSSSNTSRNWHERFKAQRKQ
ncbi:hypothetical protein Egran_06978 [Elaphomyces granulatus]|uniref:Sister chromatid cohesion protein Dcc1 n=1 Tax=Elaphomyces granulatus TaxID=519963 RepID=A0A232LMB1_9EURO|nr:hypothetical protein Egran_06978 [Elaphomyces granulatus]